MTTSKEARKAHEMAHGSRIAAEAERVWQRDSLAGRIRVETRFEDLKRFWGPEPQGRVLELGCGTGVWTRQLQTLPFQIVAMDLSPDLLDRARQAIGDTRIQFIVGDAEKLDFEDASFDYVCGLSVLHHLDLPRVLPELYRVLKPGGRIWFSEPNMMNPQIFLQKNIPWLKRWAGDTPDETAFFRWGLRKNVEETGFRQVEVLPFDFLHPSIPDGWVSWMVPLTRRLETVPVLREIAGSLLLHAWK